MTAISSWVTALRETLGPVVKGVAFGNRERDLNTEPPFLFVYPVSSIYGVPQGPGRSANPRALHTEKLTFELHCWGVTHDDADALKNAVITALRILQSGAGYSLDGSTWGDPYNTDLGAVVVVRATVMRVVPEMNLAAPLTPAVATPVVVTSVGFDADTSVDGDGQLDAEEPA